MRVGRRSWLAVGRHASNNHPLPFYRRDPLTIGEAAYIVGRFGRRSWQAMSVMTGVSQSSIRRTTLIAEQSAPPEPRKPKRPRKLQELPTAVPLRTATLSLAEAAHELGLTSKALHAWLIQERWIRRGRRGALIAGAAQLTAGLLNQPVDQVDDGSRMHIHYGAIRFTPRGMTNLRASVASTCGAAQ